MCGIVGYIGDKDARPILVEGLKRLEYRGYDSAGVALLVDSHIKVSKTPGKVSKLEEMLHDSVFARIGIGHTRWATHGEPNIINAHPHSDCTGNILLVHNGIIENYSALKTKLISLGHKFKSQTDTEVLAHLIEEFYPRAQSLEFAVRLALKEVDGTFGIVVMSASEPEVLIAARRGSPLVIGLGDSENFIASDASALIKHTREVIYLHDNEIAILTKNNVALKNLDDEIVERDAEHLTFGLEQIEKGGFAHFMLKEIHEQPETVLNAMRGRLLDDEGISKMGGLRDVEDKIVDARRFVITACGTSWHAALVGKYIFEQCAKIPVEVDYASEFRYRNPVLLDGDIVWAISQSGETADTLAALREAKLKEAPAYGIVNVVGSTIARDSEAGVYIHAGPEIGVASTKAFTSQLVVLNLINLLVARRKGNLSLEQGKEIVEEMHRLPEKIKQIFNSVDQIEKIADEFKGSRNFLYLGRGVNFPVALEGALKLKEISYIHAEGYPAAEMKHGPIALIDENMPAVFIALRDSTYDKVLSNIQEVRARKGRVIAIANEADDRLREMAEYIIEVPKTMEILSPILSVIPLQLLAYYIAVRRGCNVDQPRNLAKSVTVE
ncbi:MAG: glutamine--fructose-6-phosphate transaminase (isomerizing) [Bacteroidetes bacterium]|nr:glutamine--fructose-6-phosphate transaminase (isomerizing) [Bacteroidota bacterium]MCL5737302.1 glutamine--fructose-6-phosphate transaminase (isomerizing) [Bacteroidota bacterium]